ncbi:MAG: alpha/beta hydrolase, partial [Sphingobacteriales bacterium]
MKTIFFALISFCFLNSSCTKDDAPGSQVNASTQLNVAYGTDPLQKADIYLPANRSTANTKVLVMIHGGGWSGGDKADFNAFVDTFKRRFPDYAVANIN